MHDDSPPAPWIDPLDSLRNLHTEMSFYQDIMANIRQDRRSGIASDNTMTRLHEMIDWHDTHPGEWKRR